MPNALTPKRIVPKDTLSYLILVLSLLYSKGVAVGQTPRGSTDCSFAADCARTILAVEIHERPMGATNGINANFSLRHLPIKGLPMDVLLDGLRLTPERDFTVGKRTVAFVRPPNIGDSLEITYYTNSSDRPIKDQASTVYSRRQAVSDTRDYLADAAIKQLLLEEGVSASSKSGSRRSRQDNEGRTDEELPKGLTSLLKLGENNFGQEKIDTQRAFDATGIEGVGENTIRSSFQKTATFQTDSEPRLQKDSIRMLEDILETRARGTEVPQSSNRMSRLRIGKQKGSTK